VTNASVNPARSIGPALFAGGPYIAQLWLFIIAPLIGAVAAGLVTRLCFRRIVERPGGRARQDDAPRGFGATAFVPCRKRVPEKKFAGLKPSRPLNVSAWPDAHPVT
jgi:hypothetical protein